MIKVLALTTLDQTLALREALEEIHQDHGDLLQIKKIYFTDYEDHGVPLDPVRETAEAADLILVDVRGDSRLTRALPGMLQEMQKTVVVLVAGSAHIFALCRMGKFRGEMMFKPEREQEFSVEKYIRTRKFSRLTEKLGRILPIGMLKDMRRWILAQQYYSEGDAENLKHMLLMLLKHYCGARTIGPVPPPRPQPGYGLYHPNTGMVSDLESFLKKIGHDPHRPTVGLLFYGGMHFFENRPMVDALCRYLEDTVNLVPVYAKVEHNLTAMEQFFNPVDLILNLQYFRLHGGPYGGDPAPAYALLQKIDAPLLTALRAYETEIASWRESDAGLSPLEIILGITLPELDGAIEPVFTAGLEAAEDPHMGTVKAMKVLPGRIVRLGERTRGWLRLRGKPNSAKRVALLTYNYPPGEANLASAGYLDVFASLARFMEKMRGRGYQIKIPERPLKDFFLEEGILNSPQYSQGRGIKVPLSEYLQWYAELPPGLRRKVEARWGPPPGEIMVDGEEILVPGRILGNLFMGVQPSRGVHEESGQSYHDQALPPHHQYLAFYLYLQHRFQADCLVHFGMHGTLEFTPGKEVALSESCFPDQLIGNLPHLYYYWVGNTAESTIAKRRAYALCLSHGSPPVQNAGLYEQYSDLEELLLEWERDGEAAVKRQVEALAEELHLPGEAGALRGELFKMKRRLIPHGLYIMDRAWSPDELANTLYGILRLDGEFPSILTLAARAGNEEWEEIRETPRGEAVEAAARSAAAEILTGNPPPWLPEGYAGQAREIAGAITAPAEGENLLKAMEGRYILPARGGDPLRDAGVYPTGRAMFAFDPRLVPTAAAERRGRRAAELLAANFFEREERYPGQVAMVLWGFETMKTGGDTIAAVLALMGVRLKPKANRWFKELEAIPLEELGRPRIDVLITICGIFRDTFGTQIELINRAVELAAGLEEPPEMNFVRKHVESRKGELGELSAARIFGPSPTEYATSLTTMIEKGDWEKEEVLADNFDQSLSYAYFQGRVVENRAALSGNLQAVELVAQERDNTEYEVTDLDHYYEYLGGLTGSIGQKKGEKPPVLVVDTTEESVAVEDLQRVVERASRTRLFNPAWLEGMLKHDFHGAKKIKDRVEYLLGFAATAGVVESWVFDAAGERLFFDEDMREKLSRNNPYATMKMGELLMEASRRGYWQAEPEKLKRLQNLLLEMEGDLEE